MTSQIQINIFQFSMIHRALNIVHKTGDISFDFYSMLFIFMLLTNTWLLFHVKHGVIDVGSPKQQE